MSEINPISRLYSDIIRILNSLVIKYSVEADKYETMEIRAKADRYMDAILRKDTYLKYDDYTEADFIAAGLTDESQIEAYVNDRMSVPLILRDKVLEARREREIREYDEGNDYYRKLNGFPSTSDTDFIYVDPKYCELYEIPTDLPIHLIEDTLGSFYINNLEDIGYLDELRALYPDKEYLKFVGYKRISIEYARTAKNFAVLHINTDDIMESTYREFVRSYDKARTYFMSVAYVYQYRTLVPYYDNFIALCIFVMAIQQVSMRGIQNAVDREFYDEYMVQLLYETYGMPYFSRIDESTQKQIVQNLNLLVQNKATDKVIIDIGSILGFNDVSIYQYYLMKEHKIDENGRPIIKKTKKVNTATGKEEEVYDVESMYSLHFQKVPIDSKNIKEDLTNPVNRVEYSELTYYDPFWWEDDDLYKEIWESEYNYTESKYIGATTPYRLTEMLFQAIILLRMILEKDSELTGVTIELPRIMEKTFTLPDAVILFFALMAKKYHISGQILTQPSKLIHVMEVLDQEINKESDHAEVLGFDFDAFKPENVNATKAILEKHLVRREYRVVDGHDVDLREDGTQDPKAPTHKIQYEVNSEDLDEFLSYIQTLTIHGATPADKVKSLNKIYENIQLLYDFLSYHMSLTTDPDEYYALKTFYDVAFYTQETNEMFKVIDDDGVEHVATTFEEYFKYKDDDVYKFIQNVEEDDIYAIIDHIIFKMEELNLKVGHLYILNDGFSPLMELLQIMITFFKSYALDFVELTSLMVIDWELENTVRFFGVSDHISKIDCVEDRFGQNFTDLIYDYLVHYRIEDKIKLVDYIAAHAAIHVEDSCLLTDMQKYVNARKVDRVKDQIALFDSSRIQQTNKINDFAIFEDVCMKIKED